MLIIFEEDIYTIQHLQKDYKYSALLLIYKIIKTINKIIGLIVKAVIHVSDLSICMLPMTKAIFKGMLTFVEKQLILS